MRREFDQLAEQAAKLQSSLNRQTVRNRKLEQDLQDIQTSLNNQPPSRTVKPLSDEK